MAVFVATLFVTCLAVFLMTGGNALTGLATMPKVHSAPLEKDLVIPDQAVTEHFSSFTKESGDIQLLAKDVVDRLNQAKTAKDLYTLMFILKQMQQEVVNFQESQNTAVKELSKLLTEKDDQKLNDRQHLIKSLDLRTKLMFEAFDRRDEAIASFWIANGVKLNARHPTENKSILQLAVTRQWLTVIQQLIERGVKASDDGGQNETLLLQAVREGASAEFIQTLIVDLKADVDAVEGSVMGETALHLAVRLDRIELVRLLIQHQGFKGLEAQDERGFCPLHSAVINGSSAMIGLLIISGAQLESRTLIGMTPLHLAVIENREAAVQNLIMFGADMLAKDDHGSTPVDYAGMHKEIERILNNYMIFRQHQQ